METAIEVFQEVHSGPSFTPMLAWFSVLKTGLKIPI